MSVIDRLAKTAAAKHVEKRAYGYMGGGGMPYGGYGFNMNPYLGGMQGGMGRWGMGNGMMMGQHQSSPYGRQSYYGMNPDMMDVYRRMYEQRANQANQAFSQQLGQQGRMFDQSTLPGAQIDLQGRQLGINQQRQMDPAIERSRSVENAVLGHDMAEPTLADPNASSLLDQIKAQREVMDTAQAAHQKQIDAMGVLQKTYGDQLSKLQPIIGKLRGGSNAETQMMTYAARGDPQAIQAMIASGHATSAEDAVAKAKDNTGWLGNAYRRNTWDWMQGGTDDWEAAQTAITEKQRLEAEQKARIENQQTAVGSARQSYETAQKAHASLLAQQQQMVADRKRVLEARELAARTRMNNVAGRVGSVAGTSEGTATKELNNPTELNKLPTGEPPSTAPGTTPSPSMEQPAIVPSGQPLEQPNAPTTPVKVAPSGGGSGPHGKGKVVSLAELATKSARIHFEYRLMDKRAGLGEMMARFGSPPRHRPLSEIQFNQIRGAMRRGAISPLPNVAQAATPNLPQDASIAGLPRSAGHLTPDAARAMGIGEGQYGKLRALMGLQ